jgi:SSS family solute:Na+ symporter
MELFVTFGMVGVFFLVIIAVLYLARLRDANFSEYAVGGRSFNGFYVAMSFLNTWWPGTTFIAFAGLTAAAGVIGFYALLYSLLTVILMYLIAKRVWVWGARNDVRTQPDLLALRFDSKLIRPVAAVINVISTFPWVVLGMQALGLVFRYLSLGHLTVVGAMLLGIGLIGVRQIWTIQMGMRGVVITDMIQGLVAYVIGALLIIGVLAFFFHGFGPLDSLQPGMYRLPGPGSAEGPLYFFSLVATGALGGWSWGSIFVRLFTSDGVRSLKHSAFVGLPISFVFFALLTLFALSGASLPAVAKAPQEVWFIVNQQAGGVWLLALAGVIVFAATMGNIDGNIQALGAIMANDIAGAYLKLSDSTLSLVAKLSMAALVVISVVTAVFTFSMPNLVSLAQMSYQGIIQLAVPQFVGIFWKKGNRYGANAGLIVGFLSAVILTAIYPNLVVPGLGGITTGFIGLLLNVLIYVVVGLLVPASAGEVSRVARLFDSARLPHALPEPEPAAGE